MAPSDAFIESTFHKLEEAETDPNGKLPHEPGAKLDVGKAPVFQGFIDYFPRAMMAVAEVSNFGATKYAWKGWESVENGELRYKDAEARHSAYASMGEEFDADSGLLHEAHRVWNAMAALELKLRARRDTTGSV